MSYTRQQAAASLSEVYGPKCAAWLVRIHKKQFHTRGLVELRVYRGKLEEAWRKKRAVFVGLEYLRGQRRWHVTTEKKGIEIYFRVHYLGNELGRASAGLGKLA